MRGRGRGRAGASRGSASLRGRGISSAGSGKKDQEGYPIQKRREKPLAIRLLLNRIEFERDNDFSSHFRLFTVEAACFDSTERDEADDTDFQPPKLISRELMSRDKGIFERSIVSFLKRNWGDLCIWDKGSLAMVRHDADPPETLMDKPRTLSDNKVFTIRLVEGITHSRPSTIQDYGRRMGMIFDMALKTSITELNGTILESEKGKEAFYPVTCINANSVRTSLRTQFESLCDDIKDEDLNAIRPFSVCKGFSVTAEMECPYAILDQTTALEEDTLSAYLTVMPRFAAMVESPINLIELLTKQETSTKRRALMGGFGSLEDRLSRSIHVLKKLKVVRDKYPEDFPYKDQELRITKISRKDAVGKGGCANSLKITTPDKKTLVLAEYFLERYNIKLEYPHLPLIHYKRKGSPKEEQIPAELIKIIPQIVGNLEGSLKESFKDFGRVTTNKFRNLLNAVAFNFFVQDNPAKNIINAWGLNLKLSDHPDKDIKTAIAMREGILAEEAEAILKNPVDGSEKAIDILDGRWRLGRSEEVHGVLNTVLDTSDRGLVYIISLARSESTDKMDAFISLMIDVMERVGWTKITPKLVPIDYEDLKQELEYYRKQFPVTEQEKRLELKAELGKAVYQKVVKHQKFIKYRKKLKDAGKKVRPEIVCDGIFFILPEARREERGEYFRDFAYESMKWTFENIYKISCQCLQYEKTPCLGSRYDSRSIMHLSSIVSGMNAKRNNCDNFTISHRVLKDNFESENVMFLALDMKRGGELQRTSLGNRCYATICCNLNKDWTKWATTGRVQLGLRGNFLHLHTMMMDLMKRRFNYLKVDLNNRIERNELDDVIAERFEEYGANMAIPVRKCIIFLNSREYVYERSRAAMELDIIRGVLHDSCGVKPEITVLCCVRNHTMRILPENTRTLNCQPGTIAITRKSLADKYSDEVTRQIEEDLSTSTTKQDTATNETQTITNVSPTSTTVPSPDDSITSTECTATIMKIDEKKQIEPETGITVDSTPEIEGIVESDIPSKSTTEEPQTPETDKTKETNSIECDQGQTSDAGSAHTEGSGGSGATGTTNTSGGSDLWSFSLCPEFCILGHTVMEGTTGRPSKITILRDDLNLTSDVWGRIIFGLQHLDQVNSKTVTLPAPLNYADKAYNRIKVLADSLLHSREAESQGDLKQVYDLVNEELASQLMRVPPNSFY